jgi:L-iditol 2-dehydrogenase
MGKEMNAAVLHAVGDLRYERVGMPAAGEGEALVRVRAAGVCGSDLGRVMTTGTYRFPTIPGHEFCGEIVETGSRLRAFARGDRVVVAPLLPCGRCEFCESGDFGLCEDYDYLGSRRDGGFAEYVVAPERNLLRLPDELSFLEGAGVEPAAVTLHGLLRVGIGVGDTVAVLGCGALGLFALQFARIMGASRVFAVDIAPDKLALAGILGADECVNSAEVDAVERILELTGGRGASVALETAGAVQTQEQCLRIVRKKGRVLYLGTAHRDVVIPPKSFERIVRHELSLMGSWNSYSAPFPGVEWQSTIDFLRSGSFKLKPLITHVFDLSEAPKVFVDLVKRTYPYTKVMFEPSDKA